MVAETDPVASAAELLTSGTGSAKSNADLMQMCWKAIHTDESLRENLKNAQTRLHEWEAAAKGVPEKLQKEVDDLRTELQVANKDRRTHLVEKRKLQMSIKDAQRKSETSEKKLSEILGQMEQTIDGDAEQRAKILEVELVEKRSAVAELATMKEEVSDLRERVAELTTQLEFEKDIKDKVELRCGDLEKELSLKRVESSNMLAEASQPTRTAPPRAPPMERKPRKHVTDQPTKPIDEQGAPSPFSNLNLPVLGAGSLICLTLGYVLGSAKGAARSTLVQE
eukprot:TRINITY_DN8724_c0_g1_i1.p1 TRINITY_DN8724_c0_g1~~TRINITY_DN8724_c0_g1_i1.p1  ORF type:complete len:281 (+),score=49.73 TRINITY_DN8724_c0_g1_i1:50-892(+)